METPTCFPDLNNKSTADDQAISLHQPQTVAAGEPAGAGFECNICLELAADPVVTTCGHLYCWPCIYRWSHKSTTSSSLCPICKSPFSQSSLIPLYGCGLDAKSLNREIPDRPKDHRKLVAPPARISGDDRRPRLSSNYRDFYASSYQTRGMRELRVEIWLNQVWVFLLCCAFLCLVFF